MDKNIVVNKSILEAYVIDGKEYKFDKAPIYEKESLMSLKEIKKLIEEKDFIGEQKLVKFNINGNMYSDIFTKYKIFSFGSHSAAFLNHHSFEGNAAACEGYAFAEQVYIFDSNLNIINEFTNVLFDYVGEIVKINLDSKFLNAVALENEGMKLYLSQTQEEQK